LPIRQQVVRGKEALASRYKAKKFIVYFQSFTNTYAPVNKLQQLYEEALSVKDVVGLSIGTRPDCLSPMVLDLLRRYAAERLIWLELGLQSAHDATLAAINRGHDFRCFQEAVAISHARELPVCAHVILGLPGETRRHMLQTAEAVADLGIDGIKLHLLYVVRGTRLAQLYHRGAYRCLSQQDYVRLACDFLERLPSATVIQRLTGDPHPGELVAPQWALRKRETLDLINGLLGRRDAWQGKKRNKRLEISGL
jgi:radical SAM protein (TIGR01212 family)